MVAQYTTRFGSLAEFEKGRVDIINDDPRHYAFSNVFDVASRAQPYEKIAVGKNMEYVLEAVRAEGDSDWRTAAHDEFALVMDGEVEVHLIQPEKQLVPEGKEGSVQLTGEPKGKKMGWVKAGRGHMAIEFRRIWDVHEIAV